MCALRIILWISKGLSANGSFRYERKVRKMILFMKINVVNQKKILQKSKFEKDFLSLFDSLDSIETRARKLIPVQRIRSEFASNSTCMIFDIVFFLVIFFRVEFTVSRIVRSFCDCILQGVIFPC